MKDTAAKAGQDNKIYERTRMSRFEDGEEKEEKGKMAWDVREGKEA